MLRASKISTQLTGMKSYKDFQAQYLVKAPVKPRCSAMTVILKDLNTMQVCRKLRMADMPCKCMSDTVVHLQALSGLEHPHICRFIEVFEDGNYLYLIYERANQVTLFDHIKDRGSLTEEEAADYMRQVAMALSVAHSQGIVHGRLSPRHMILTNQEDDDEEDCDTQLKICDMGQGFILRPSLFDVPETEKALEMEQYACSPEFIQKELVSNGSIELPKHAEKNDIWALGMIFFHMLSGCNAFEVTSREELAKCVGRKSIVFNDMWTDVSPSARDVVEQMLRVNPSIRISAAALLRHQWVKVARTKFPRRRMVQLLGNLRTNVEESEFKRFVLRVIAEQLPRDGKTEQVIEQAFRCLDRNGDGVLTVEEVTKGLKKHLELDSKNRDLEWLFAQIDRDGSGTINVQEFMSASMDQKRSTSLPVLWEAFSAFDKDRSGHITYDEIGRIVKEVEGQLVSMEQADSCSAEIVRELEVAGSGGGLHFEHFVALMMPVGQDVLNTHIYRGCWTGCKVDCYNVRHMETQQWDLTREKIRANRSVYRRKASRRRSEAPVDLGYELGEDDFDQPDMEPVSAG